MTSKTKWIPLFHEEFLRYDTKKDEWIEVKRLKDTDEWEDSHIEYSVVRENTHGEKSWGWGDGIDKIILFNDMQLPSKLPQLRELCIKFAEFLNKENF